jgi:hypothetical protein
MIDCAVMAHPATGKPRYGTRRRHRNRRAWDVPRSVEAPVAGKRVDTRLTWSLYKLAYTAAKANGLTVQGLIRRLLWEYVQPLVLSQQASEALETSPAPAGQENAVVEGAGSMPVIEPEST